MWIFCNKSLETFRTKWGVKRRLILEIEDDLCLWAVCGVVFLGENGPARQRSPAKFVIRTPKLTKKVFLKNSLKSWHLVPLSRSAKWTRSRTGCTFCLIQGVTLYFISIDDSTIPCVSVWVCKCVYVDMGGVFWTVWPMNNDTICPICIWFSISRLDVQWLSEYQ